MHGKYCSNCGQKIIHPEDKKLRHLITEFFHHFTHLDGKFLKTLRNILLRPGNVTRDISLGKTVPHFKLSALFLVGTIIYYLLPSNVVVSTPANVPYKVQVTNSEFQGWKSEFAAKKSRAKNISLADLEARYNNRNHTYGKLLILLFIPLLIPILWIISKFVRRFNPDNIITAYDLGVASLEINSIILYGAYLITGIFIWLVTLLFPIENIVLMGAIIFLIGLLTSLFLFFKRAYQIAWWQALLCLVFLVFGYIYILQLYGFLAFLIFI